MNEKEGKADLKWLKWQKVTMSEVNELQKHVWIVLQKWGKSSIDSISGHVQRENKGRGAEIKGNEQLISFSICYYVWASVAIY